MTRERDDPPTRNDAKMAAVLAHLHQARATTSSPWPNGIEDIRILRDIYGLSLREALSIMQEDPTWRGVEAASARRSPGAGSGVGRLAGYRQ